MPVRKMTKKEKNELFGDGVVLPLRNPDVGPKSGKHHSGDSEFQFLQFSKKHGKGFSASLMNGPSVDLFEVADLEWTSDLNDAVWSQYNWKDLLEECEGVEIIETGGQDHTPGMSDVFFWVAVFDPKNFKKSLRKAILASGRINNSI